MEKKIQAELMSAMKEKNAEKTAAIREIKTAIMKFKTSAEYKGECTDADILNLIQKIAKQFKIFHRQKLTFTHENHFVSSTDIHHNATKR